MLRELGVREKLAYSPALLISPDACDFGAAQLVSAATQPTLSRFATFFRRFSPYPAPGSLRRGAAWARWPSRSSKPVRCGNPTLGRFDSGAAPLSRLRIARRARGRLDHGAALSRSAA